MQSEQHNLTGHNLLGYIPARLTANKRWYVEWYSYNPDTGKMQRKRISVPHITPQVNRRRYANEMVLNINAQLASGWNPFLQLNNPREYTLFDTVCEQYYRYLYKMVESEVMRPKSYNGYTSFLKVFREWNKKSVSPVIYVYQLKKTVIDRFLDYIWLDCQKSPRTRDNYLSWLKTFCKWMLEKNYISDDPTVNFTKVIGKKYDKNRTVIPAGEMLKLKEYLFAHNKHFLLACYILYYCFIRPKEMSYIKIGDISVAKGTIHISAKVAKNKKDSVVTLPDCVLKLMLELEVLTKPCDWYLFSDNDMPGKAYRQPKCFCDDWNVVRKNLGFPDKYKFYSLKDTGITDLIRANTDLIAVRDQARHSSLVMTDLYTPMEAREANESIRHHQSYF